MMRNQDRGFTMPLQINNGYNHHGTTNSRRIALVTGASRGLGKTLARFLAQHGWDLLLTARGRDDLAATAAELETYGSAIIALPGDVRGAEHRRHLIREAGARGGLHWLINNASMLGVSPLVPLADFELERFEQVLDVNLLAPVALVQAAFPLLKQSGGLVINISSDAAVGGYAGWGAYGASKAALDLVSITLAAELRDQGVGVISVDPGDLRTQMHQAAYPGEDISDRPLPDITLPFWAWLVDQNPLSVSGRRYQAQADAWTTENS